MKEMTEMVVEEKDQQEKKGPTSEIRDFLEEVAEELSVRERAVFMRGVAGIESKFIELINEIMLRDDAILSKGLHLEKEIFIPEYLGFTENILTSADGKITRIYHCNNIMITRIEDDYWLFKDNNLENSGLKLKIENMYDALKALTLVTDSITIDGFLNKNEYSKKMDVLMKVMNENRSMLGRLKKSIEKVSGCEFSDLRSKSRKRKVTDLRKVFCYLARRYTNMSLKEVGAEILRDHSTALAAERKAEELSTSDAEFRELLNNIEYDFMNP